MTLKEFQKQDVELKYDLTFKQGTYLHTIVYEEEKVNLYNLFNFFVEIIYDRSSNKIIAIKPFEEGFLLSRYARSISADMKTKG